MTYLDFAATTPMSEEALETYRAVSLEVYGNTRSLHDTGGQAQHIVDYCRAQLGELLGAETEGIYFTSGGRSRIISSFKAYSKGSLPHGATSSQHQWSMPPFAA